MRKEQGKFKKKKRRCEVRFGELYVSAIRWYAVPATVVSALCAASAFAASQFRLTVSYVVFYIMIAVLFASVLASSVSWTLTLVDRSEKKMTRTGVAASTLFAVLLSVSCVSAAVVFLSVLMVASPMISLASSLAFLSASLYVSSLLSVETISHDLRKKEEHKRFILGFAGIYTVGLLLLLLFIGFASSIPLGEDFDGESVPEGTIAALSAIYLSATLLRSVCLFFLARYRLKTKAKLR